MSSLESLIFKCSDPIPSNTTQAFLANEQGCSSVILICFQVTENYQSPGNNKSYLTALGFVPHSMEMFLARLLKDAMYRKANQGLPPST